MKETKLPIMEGLTHFVSKSFDPSKKEKFEDMKQGSMDDEDDSKMADPEIDVVADDEEEEVVKKEAGSPVTVAERMEVPPQQTENRLPSPQPDMTIRSGRLYSFSNILKYLAIF
jgi:hypothetical protein